MERSELDRRIRESEKRVRTLLLRASVEASPSAIKECNEAADELRGLHAMRIGDMGDEPSLPTY